MSAVGNAWLKIARLPRVEHLVTETRVGHRPVERFVAGPGIEDAIRAVKELNADGLGGILDLLGESVNHAQDAARARDEYMECLERVEATGVDTTISVKLTQLGLAFDRSTCIKHVRDLARQTARIGTTLEIDMEQSEHVSATLDVYRHVRAGFDDVRVACQAYLRRTPLDLERLKAIGPRFRLVKGAYQEPGELALQKRNEIALQYKFLTEQLMRCSTDPAIATHDEELIEHAARVARERGPGERGFEIQMLYGIRRDLQRRLASKYRVRVYVPFGTAWYPYLTRRIAEKPANMRLFLRAVAGR